MSTAKEYAELEKQQTKPMLWPPILAVGGVVFVLAAGFKRFLKGNVAASNRAMSARVGAQAAVLIGVFGLTYAYDTPFVQYYLYGPKPITPDNIPPEHRAALERDGITRPRPPNNPE